MATGVGTFETVAPSWKTGTRRFAVPRILADDDIAVLRSGRRTPMGVTNQGENSIRRTVLRNSQLSETNELLRLWTIARARGDVGSPIVADDDRAGRRGVDAVDRQLEDLRIGCPDPDVIRKPSRPRSASSRRKVWNRSRTSQGSTAMPISCRRGDRGQGPLHAPPLPSGPPRVVTCCAMVRVRARDGSVAEIWSTWRSVDRRRITSSGARYVRC